jgi:hypothetical protein
MSRDRTANHEAAHAVVARALGIDVVSVTIEPHGRVVFDRMPAARHEHVLMFMAGPIGATIFAGKPDVLGRLSDAEQVHEEMRALGTSAHRWNVYQAAARRLVRANWPTIRTVVAELLRHDHGQMNGYWLDQIITHT